MKRTISYISYAAAALALIALALPHQVDIGLGLLFAITFGVGNTNRVLAKWEKDGAYQKEALDERNIAIKEKAGNITGMLTTTLLGISLVFFVCMGYTVPALVAGGIMLVQFVSLICVSSLLEKKM